MPDYLPADSEIHVRFLGAALRRCFLGRTGEKSVIHSLLSHVSSIVEGSEPAVQWKHTVSAVIAFEILMMKIVEEVAGLHTYTISEHHAFET